MDPLTEKNRIADRMTRCQTLQQLHAVWRQEAKAIVALMDRDKALYVQTVKLKDYLKPTLMDDPAMCHPSEVPE